MEINVDVGHADDVRLEIVRIGVDFCAMVES